MLSAPESSPSPGGPLFAFEPTEATGADAERAVVFHRTRRQLLAESALFPVLGGAASIVGAAVGWSPFELSGVLVVTVFLVAVASTAFTAWWIGHEQVAFHADRVVVVTRFGRSEIPWADIAEIRTVRVAGGSYPQVIRRDPAAKPHRAAVPNTSFGAFVDPEFDTKIAQMQVQRLAALAREQARAA